VVYLNNTNAAFTPNVYFYGNAIDVEWTARPTNLFETNTLVVNFLDIGAEWRSVSIPGRRGWSRLTSIPFNFFMNVSNQTYIARFQPCSTSLTWTGSSRCLPRLP